MTRPESYDAVYEQLLQKYRPVVAAVLAADVLKRRAAALRGRDTRRRKIGETAWPANPR
jgi:hypothetical protein